METYAKKKEKNRIVSHCQYHVVWCPVFRRPIITEEMQIRIKERIKAICEEQEITIVRGRIGKNFVYLQVDVPHTLSIGDTVAKLKRQTASMLREEYPHLQSQVPNIWNRSVFVTTEKQLPIAEVEEWFLSQPKCWQAGRKMRMGAAHGTE